MPELLEATSLRLNNKKIRGRAINAVAEMFRHHLSIPHIYLEPQISGVSAPDILAVDRAGSGDLHAVRIKALSVLPTKAQLRSVVDEIMLSPFHFRYLALPRPFTAFDGALKFAELSELFDDTGIGRIGVIAFDSTIRDACSLDGHSAVTVVVRPERFRVRGRSLTTIEKFLDKTVPDIAVRI